MRVEQETHGQRQGQILLSRFVLLSPGGGWLHVVNTPTFTMSWKRMRPSDLVLQSGVMH